MRGRTGAGDKWRRRRARPGAADGTSSSPSPDLSPEEALEQERRRLELERNAIENDQSLIAEVGAMDTESYQ